MNNKTIQAIKISALAIVLSLGIGYALAWTAPTVTPPGGNVSAPINTSGTAQTKAGALTLSGLLTSAGLTLTGAGNKITFPDGSTLATSEPFIQFFKPTTPTPSLPDVIQSGNTAQLSWQTKGMRTTPAPCSITGTGGPYSNLTETSSITTPILTGPGNYTFVLSCVGVNGTTVQETTIVNVLAPFSKTFSNGESGTVNIPYGVTKLTFSGSGGKGGRGYYNGTQAGGGLMSGISQRGAGTDGGSNGNSITGAGGNGGAGGGWGGAGGLAGNNGGVGGNCWVGINGNGINGGTNGGNVGYYSAGYIYSGGGGGGGAFAKYESTPIVVLGGGGGAAGYTTGGGAGGGYGGGGGGGSTCTVAGGGGGGGGGFIDPDFDNSAFSTRSILLSQIASGLIAPTSIDIGTGTGGISGLGGVYNGQGGTITVSW